jgi:curli biogenesis system outer membrane secretion channel CsgG
MSWPMKKLTFTLLLLFASNIVSADELSKGEKDTIFIKEVRVLSSVNEIAAQQKMELHLKSVIEKMNSQFTNSLNQTRVFQLVERGEGQKAIDEEQKFARVVVDPNDKNMAQALKQAGAKFVFLPEIDSFEDKTSSNTRKLDFIGESVTTVKRSIFLSASVKIVDTTTSKLLPDSPSVQVDTSMLPSGVTGEQLYEELAKIAATKLAQNTVITLRPPKVLDVTGPQIMINRGIESGFPVDTTIEIYAIKEVKDDDTGEVFRSEFPVGKAKVIRGDTKQSFATIVGDNLGIAPGCVARPIKSKGDKKPASTPVKKEKSGVVKEKKKADSEW